MTEIQWIDEQAIAELEDDTSAEFAVQVAAMFLKETRSRMQRVVTLVESGDLEALRQEVHTLASGAGTFGAARLEHAARAVEAACRADDPRQALGLARRLPAVAEETSLRLRDRFD